MKWKDAGDCYVLEAESVDPIARSYNGELFRFVDDVIRLMPATNDAGQRVGWHIFEKTELVPPPNGLAIYMGWQRVTDTPIIMLHEAKAVAEAWWRMR